MNDLISVIVPVYNVENYLKDCVNSLLGQTYKNIEIILVDDGSTDASRTMCDAFAKSDNRIKVYHKENGGLSSARNYGLNKAKGDFVCFIDSDDMYSVNFVETLYNIQKQSDCKIVMCRLSRNIKDLQVMPNTNYEIIQSCDCLKNIYYQKDDALFTVTVCTKLFKKELFDTVKFSEGRIYEDYGISYDLFSEVNTIAYTNFVGYYYRINNNSITTKKVAEKNFDVIYFSEKIYETILVENPNLTNAIKSMLFRRCVQLYGRIVSAKQLNLYNRLPNIWKRIVELRLSIIIDRDAPLKNKICALLTFAGKYIFNIVMKFMY